MVVSPRARAPRDFGDGNGDRTGPHRSFPAALPHAAVAVTDSNPVPAAALLSPLRFSSEGHSGDNSNPSHHYPHPLHTLPLKRELGCCGLFGSAERQQNRMLLVALAESPLAETSVYACARARSNKLTSKLQSSPSAPTPQNPQGKPTGRSGRRKP